jgi:hypothetical protein
VSVLALLKVQRICYLILCDVFTWIDLAGKGQMLIVFDGCIYRDGHAFLGLLLFLVAVMLQFWVSGRNYVVVFESGGNVLMLARRHPAIEDTI